MNKSKYEETLEKIKTSEKFQNDTIAKLKDSIANEKIVSTRKSKIDYKRIGVLAASLAFVITAGVGIRGFYKSEKVIVENSKEPTYEENYDKYLNDNYLASLPKLKSSIEPGGMGFAALMAYNVDELNDNNPWSENDDLKVLPIFTNTLYTKDPNQWVESYLTGDEMLNKANEVAEILKVEVTEAYIEPTEAQMKFYEDKTGEKANPNPTRAVIKGNGIEINVRTSGEIEVWYEPGDKLPSSYKFSYQTKYKDAEKTMKYLIEKYKYLIDMKSPQINITGQYTFYGEQNFDFNIYEGYGSLLDKILGYNFNTIKFAPNDKGSELWLIRKQKTDLSQVIGYYPTISAEEAKELLVSGKGITSVPEKFPGKEYISRVKLVYYTGYQEVFMPYYEFLVEMPTMQEKNGLKTYGIYYVPAIKSEYISEMPVYDGSFN